MARPKLLIGGLLSVLALSPGTRAFADELTFGPDLQRAGWRVVSFPGIAPASFKANGRSGLEVSTDSAAGLLCQTLSKTLWQTRKASWRWRVRQSVPATDL